jgi:hypothetical protein
MTLQRPQAIDHLGSVLFMGLTLRVNLLIELPPAEVGVIGDVWIG